MFSAETINLISKAAKSAAIEPAALMAVIDVEAGGRTHAVVEGRMEPLIRFEGHYFDRRLSPERREIARREGLASPSAGAVKNPPSQAARWRMLQRAAEIDVRAAYESTSWGMGQVMGAHWAWLGYPNVEALVEEARSGIEGQLRLTLRYIEKAGLTEALRRRDWAAFARGYNGPGFARSSYHLKLALAHRRHGRQAAAPEGTAPIPLRRGDRGAGVRHLQLQLTATGHPVSADGIFGRHTHEAVLAFQRRRGLPADGIAGPMTMASLEDAQPIDGFVQLWRSVSSLWRRILEKFGIGYAPR